ncbi:MAG TPA: cytochrome c [Candidatus Acidoferrum sp.]|jgi:mono/diheme cytochrome c family protein
MDAPQKLKLRRLLFVALLGLIVLAVVLAATRRGEWIVPEEARQRKNPLASSAGRQEEARGLYTDYCAKCHGDSGKGDGPDAGKHFTPSGDFTDAARMNAMTDGELFYKITEGRRPMPQFKTRLTDDQRWQLVSFIRSFASAKDRP